MSIKWYRDSGRRVLTPRIDKPKGPKRPPKKKNKFIGKPKSPGVSSPRVRVPFIQKPAVTLGPKGSCCDGHSLHVHARNDSTFLANLSLAGIYAVEKIARDNRLKLGQVNWHKVQESGVKCPRADKGSAINICTALSRQPGGWKTFDAFRAHRKPNIGGHGLWAYSHVNCQCFIQVKMFDPNNPEKYAEYQIYTNPSAGAGSQGGTSGIGFGWAAGSISWETLNGAISGDERKHMADVDAIDDKRRDAALDILFPGMFVEKAPAEKGKPSAPAFGLMEKPLPGVGEAPPPTEPQPVAELPPATEPQPAAKQPQKTQPPEEPEAQAPAAKPGAEPETPEEKKKREEEGGQFIGG